MTLVAAGLSAILIVFYAAHCILDTQELRRMTMETELQSIIDGLKRGENPAAWKLYTDFPHSYGFRVFDHRQAWQRKVVAEANAGLLTALLQDPETQDLVSGFTALAPATGTDDDVPWLMTGRGEAGGRVYWVQAVMIDDPAWQWTTVLARSILDHVLVPVLVIVPALTLAVFLTTRRVLRPLTRVARQARDLGGAVMSGRAIAPLSDDNLPLEFEVVVGAINAMLAKLERSLTLQKEFTSDVAHELRTPLAVLLLEVSRLPPGSESSRFKRDLCDLVDLVNQLLRFAQAEDAMVRQQQSVDLTGAVRKVCEELAATAVEQCKTIEFDAPEEPILVSGHPALIDVAIRNIVDNAVKLSPPHATVSVTVDPRRQVLVEDRGPGIADEHKEDIFERFWRGDRQRKDGTGVGLSLVRRIARLHGGDVRVEDRSGGGSRFVLHLGQP
ncbi:MAG: HAMP domain-containing sensor histidine kinase [Chthoniobacter sp.]|nr:HAMP domain-containing sensor histidine kinase [Chthoniobacter sp.]